MDSSGIPPMKCAVKMEKTTASGTTTAQTIKDCSLTIARNEFREVILIAQDNARDGKMIREERGNFILLSNVNFY
jgi:hypothetical protein